MLKSKCRYLKFKKWSQKHYFFYILWMYIITKIINFIFLISANIILILKSLKKTYNIKIFSTLNYYISYAYEISWLSSCIDFFHLNWCWKIVVPTWLFVLCRFVEHKAFNKWADLTKKLITHSSYNLKWMIFRSLHLSHRPSIINLF